MRVLRVLRYLWALPTTSIGLLFLLPTLLTGGGARWVEGVLEIHGGVASLFLRYMTLLKGGANAMTLGHVVLGRTPGLLALTRRHERVHVRQVERWGPLFLPAYMIACVITGLRGRRWYRDNPKPGA